VGDVLGPEDCSRLIGTAAPSVGTVGDALDNALDETQIGLLKTEVIHRLGPWKAPRRRRTGHPGVGGLAQPPPPAHRLPRPHPAEYEQIRYRKHPAQPARMLYNRASGAGEAGFYIGDSPHADATLVGNVATDSRWAGRHHRRSWPAPSRSGCSWWTPTRPCENVRVTLQSLGLGDGSTVEHARRSASWWPVTSTPPEHEAAGPRAGRRPCQAPA